MTTEFHLHDTVNMGGIAAEVTRLYPDEREAPEGWVQVQMVGDDRKVWHDPAGLEPLDYDAFCGGCGQVGCTHG